MKKELIDIIDKYIARESLSESEQDILSNNKQDLEIILAVRKVLELEKRKELESRFKKRFEDKPSKDDDFNENKDAKVTSILSKIMNSQNESDNKSIEWMRAAFSNDNSNDEKREELPIDWETIKTFLSEE